ncbi:MAG: tRNA uridine-5-carboxymethylaminomethyl(34) synthesis GTPase MnmE [Candidatus Omnitrophica bacterium]|nr:tRNA uridine-5-carboxymethylaminomethyl(34) synthesis GTPase MnmE [Candidatus Omnitrophota bacterium]
MILCLFPLPEGDKEKFGEYNDFIMIDARIYFREDTIAAPSTPSGRGAIAVIRISGPEAVSLCQRMFHARGSKPGEAPRRMVYGAIIDPRDGDIVDDALCAAFPGPHSYTGEDMAEFHCHGSEAVLRKTLEILFREGARPAEPGEFTFRAVRNGKMDLTQAEAVGSLIESRSQLARTLSLRMLEGAFSRDLAALKEELISALVEVETQLEFPDEAMEERLGSELQAKMDDLLRHSQALQKRAVRERRFEQGIVTVIAGRPNVGKSSLFNRLLGRERAIVTPHPGTTRDSIEGTIELAGRPITLIDTAGLRETQEEIESIGIRRSEELLSASHIVLFVFEAGEGLTPDDRVLLDRLRSHSNQSRIILTANKSDLPPIHSDFSFPAMDYPWPVIKISTVNEEGVHSLISLLEKEVADLIPAETDSAYLVNARQERVLVRLMERLQNAAQFIREQSPLELPAEDLRSALHDIAELDGSGMAPDIMTTIFSRFCIGK